MKIIIKTKNRKNIKLYLPTSVIKSRFFIKRFVDKDEIGKYRRIVKKTYRSLITYIKLNGHFDIVEIKTNKTEIMVRI